MAKRKLVKNPALALKLSMPALAIIGAKTMMQELLEEARELSAVFFQAVHELKLEHTSLPFDDPTPTNVVKALRAVSNATKKPIRAKAKVKHASHHKGLHWTQKPENAARVRKIMKKAQKARNK